jgi:lipid-A-disaccharide synthase
MDTAKHIVVITGEASGEAHATRVIQALQQQQPDIQLSGIGGDKMRAAGVELIADFSELAVMGLVEVLKRYGDIKKIFNKVVAHLQQQQPDLLVLVDYPGFNLKLAKQAKKLGIPVVYYISPKVWAWRKGRVKTIKRYVDHMAVLFPFEVPIYQQAGVPVTCVGHPLVDAVKTELTTEQAKQQLGLDANNKVLGLFPGSRNSEVQALLPTMLQAAERIQQRHPNLTIVLPLAPGLSRQTLQPLLEQSSVTVNLIEGEFYTLTKACDAIVAASGTVTLEIALLGVPHFLIYRVAPLSYSILKRLVNIPYVGLCNIITEQNIVKEILQDEVTAERLDQELSSLLSSENAQQTATQIQQQVLTALGPAGGAANAAQLIIKLLNDYEQK